MYVSHSYVCTTFAMWKRILPIRVTLLATYVALLCVLSLFAVYVLHLHVFQLTLLCCRVYAVNYGRLVLVQC